MSQENNELLQLKYQFDIIKRKIEELDPLLTKLILNDNLDKYLNPDNYEKRKKQEYNERYYKKKKG